MVGPRAADEEHGRLALARGADLVLSGLHAAISSAMTCSTRAVSSGSPKYWAILRSDFAVASAPMKFTLIQGMPYFFSIMSAT